MEEFKGDKRTKEYKEWKSKQSKGSYRCKESCRVIQ